jgi:hypothetical protein
LQTIAGVLVPVDVDEVEDGDVVAFGPAVPGMLILVTGAVRPPLFVMFAGAILGCTVVVPFLAMTTV